MSVSFNPPISNWNVGDYLLSNDYSPRVFTIIHNDDQTLTLQDETTQLTIPIYSGKYSQCNDPVYLYDSTKSTSLVLSPIHKDSHIKLPGVTALCGKHTQRNRRMQRLSDHFLFYQDSSCIRVPPKPKNQLYSFLEQLEGFSGDEIDFLHRELSSFGLASPQQLLGFSKLDWNRLNLPRTLETKLRNALHPQKPPQSPERRPFLGGFEIIK